MKRETERQRETERDQQREGERVCVREREREREIRTFTVSGSSDYLQPSLFKYIESEKVSRILNNGHISWFSEGVQDNVDALWSERERGVCEREE